MKKYINYSIVYAILAMIGGVFYREFTKFNGYTGVTTLSKVHVHLFILGMIVFLVVGLLVDQYHIDQQKNFRFFVIFYNIGLLMTVIMMIVRGVPQVLLMELSSGMNGMISGIAGLGHISLGVGIVLLLLSIKKSVN